MLPKMDRGCIVNVSQSSQTQHTVVSAAPVTYDFDCIDLQSDWNDNGGDNRASYHLDRQVSLQFPLQTMYLITYVYVVHTYHMYAMPILQKNSPD